MTLFDRLVELEKRFKGIEEHPIYSDQQLIGWHATAMSTEGRALGGGCSERRDTARQIALAEVFERALYRKLRDDETSRKELLISDFPSTSGFAAGFQAKNTLLRSACEAVERWAWSQWIDSGYMLEEIPKSSVTLSPLAKFFTTHFEDVRFFSKELVLEDPRLGTLQLQFGAILGIKGNGVFPGSRVSLKPGDPWTHASVEAWRHLKIFERGPSTDLDKISERVFHFGNNRSAAESQIAKASRKVWKKPCLQFLRSIETGIPEVYLSRAICSDFVGWHLGPRERFVY